MTNWHTYAHRAFQVVTRQDDGTLMPVFRNYCNGPEDSSTMFRVLREAVVRDGGIGRG